MSKAEYNELRILASKLNLGETQNGILCPWCSGGRNGDKAFSLTKREDGTCLFVCFRASCGRHGRLFGPDSLSVSESTRPTFNPRYFRSRTEELDSATRQVLASRFLLSNSDIHTHRISICKESGRIVIPVLGPNARLRGYETRQALSAFSEEHGRGNKKGDGRLPDSGQHRQPAPKTLHYREVDEPWLGWFVSGTSKEPIVIVEDVISAIRVSRQFVGVSLMGSHISLEDMLEITKVSDRAVLCLDRDATEKAIKLKQRFLYIAPKLEVRPLQRDLKYETDADIRRIILHEAA